MNFPKSWVLKFQNCFRHSLSITMRWNKLHWQEKSFLSKVQEPNFQKQTIKYINFLYNPFFFVFFTVKKNVLFKKKYLDKNSK